LKEAAQGSFILLVGQVVSTVVLAIAVIIVAGLLGSERYGEYTIVMVPVNIVTLLMDFGTNSSLTRALAIYHSSNKKSEAHNAIISGLLINIISSLAFSILIFTFSDVISESFLHRPELALLLKVASFSVFGNALINTTNAVFLGIGRIELRSINSILFAFLKSITTVILVYLGFGVLGYVEGRMIMLLVSGFVGLILVYIIIKNNGDSIKFDLNEIRLLIKEGSPFYLTSLVGNGLNQIYSSLMVIYASTIEIGNYGVALNFAVLANFLTGPISTMLFPFFSRFKKDDPTLQILYQDSVKYVSLITLPGAFALIALADTMITIIYSNGYPLAANFLRLYLIGYLFAGLGSISNGNLLNGQGRADVSLRCSIITLIIGGIMCLYMIPNYSIIGLIITMITAPIIGLIYSYWFIKKTYNFSFYTSSSIKLYIASFIAFLASYAFILLININRWLVLIAGGIIFIIVYLTMLKIVKVLQTRDYELFKKMLGNRRIEKILRNIIEFYEKI